MSSNEKYPTFPDANADWNKGKDGRLYINLKYGKIFKQGLKDKVNLVLAGKLPDTGNEDTQETYNSFTFENQTFSISQFDKGSGLQTLLYQGVARFPSDKPLIDPNAGQQTLPVADTPSGGQTNYKSGNSNWKGKSGSNWKPAAKVAVQGVCQEPEYVLEENLKEAVPAGGNKVYFYNAPVKYEESSGKERSLVGVLVYPS